MRASLLLVVVCAAFARVHKTMADDPPYYCTSDAYCAKKYPGTVCIGVEMDTGTIKKCTPNSGTRKACRGSNFGLCPSYQPPESEYLDAHCVFIAEDPVTSGSSSGSKNTKETPSKKKAEPFSGSGSGTTKKETGSGSAGSAGSGDTKKGTEAPKKTNATRLLEAQATTTEAPKTTTAAPKTTTAAPKSSTKESKTSSKAESKAASSNGSKAASGSGSAKGSSSGAGGGEDLPGGYTKIKVGNSTVTGRFACLTVSDCEQKAADPKNCVPSACGSDEKNLCNHQGTCTYTSKALISKRACACYLGYRGDKCQFAQSNKCDVDCGAGGDCVDGVCKCKKGFDGKSYQGKKGTPDQRCSKCTNDQACQNDGKCNTDSGKCECPAGFFGSSCGGKEDGCVSVKCGNAGACQVDKKGKGVCFCNKCDPDCKQCADNTCSTCPSPASTLHFSWGLLAAVFVAVAVNWLA